MCSCQAFVSWWAIFGVICLTRINILALRGDGGRLGAVQGAESRGPLGSIPPSAGGILRSGGCSEETSSRLYLSTPEPCERWREGGRGGGRGREGGFVRAVR